MTLSGIACCTFTCGATASTATAGCWRWCVGAWRFEPSMLPTTRPKPASFHDSPVNELALVSMSAVLTMMAMWPILLRLSRWEGWRFEPGSACHEEKVYNYHYLVGLLWGVRRRAQRGWDFVKISYLKKEKKYRWNKWLTSLYNLTFFKLDGLNEWLTPICSDCLIKKKSHVLYIYIVCVCVHVCVCVCVCVCVLRIVSRDKILHFKNILLLLLIIISQRFDFEDDACEYFLRAVNTWLWLHHS